MNAEQLRETLGAYATVENRAVVEALVEIAAQLADFNEHEGRRLDLLAESNAMQRESLAMNRRWHQIQEAIWSSALKEKQDEKP